MIASPSFQGRNSMRSIGSMNGSFIGGKTSSIRKNEGEAVGVASMGSDEEQEYIYSDDDYEYHMDDEEDDDDEDMIDQRDGESSTENGYVIDREQQVVYDGNKSFFKNPLVAMRAWKKERLLLEPDPNPAAAALNLAAAAASNRKRRNPFEVSPPKQQESASSIENEQPCSDSSINCISLSASAQGEADDDALTLAADDNTFIDSHCNSKISYYKTLHIVSELQMRELSRVSSSSCAPLKYTSNNSSMPLSFQDLEEALALVIECCRVLCTAYIKGIYFSDFLTLYHRDELEAKTQELVEIIDESLIKLVVPDEITKCLLKLKKSCHLVVLIAQEKDLQWISDNEKKSTTSNVDDDSDSEVSIASGTSTTDDEEMDDSSFAPSGVANPNGDEDTLTIHASQIDAHMDSCIEQASQRLSVPTNVAAVILKNHQWDLDALPAGPSKIRQASDANKGVHARCGVLFGGDFSPASQNTISSSATTRECDICCSDEIDSSDMFHMPCGHEYCRSCWNTYFTTSLEELGPASVDAMTCPHSGCTELITESEIREISVEKLTTFRKFQVQSFVTASKGLRFCRGTNCSAVLKLEDPSTQTTPLSASSNSESRQGSSSSTSNKRIFVTKCMECETPFCTRCGEENHHPVNCNMFQRWIEESAQESDYSNATWFVENTQKCPHCLVRIEKAGGCNNMHCTRCLKMFVWNDVNRSSIDIPNELDDIARAGLEREELQALLALVNPPPPPAPTGRAEVVDIHHHDILGEEVGAMAIFQRRDIEGEPYVHPPPANLPPGNIQPQQQLMNGAENPRVRTRGMRFRELLHLDLLTVGGNARREQLRELQQLRLPVALPLPVAENFSQIPPLENIPLRTPMTRDQLRDLQELPPLENIPRRIPIPEIGYLRGRRVLTEHMRREIFTANNNPRRAQRAALFLENHMGGDLLIGQRDDVARRLTRRHNRPLGLVDNLQQNRESSQSISPEAVLDVFDCYRKFSSLDETHKVIKETLDNFLKASERCLEGKSSRSAKCLLERSLESCEILKYSYVYRFCMEHPSAGERQWSDTQRWSFGRRQNKLESSISLVWKLDKLLLKCAKFTEGHNVNSRTLALRRFLTNVPELTELSIN